MENFQSVITTMRKPLITLSSDFGPGNVGCGSMEAVAASICPEARIVQLCHNITLMIFGKGQEYWNVWLAHRSVFMSVSSIRVLEPTDAGL